MLEEGGLRHPYAEPLLQPDAQPHDEDGGQPELVERGVRVGRPAEEGGEFEEWAEALLRPVVALARDAPKGDAA